MTTGGDVEIDTAEDGHGPSAPAVSVHQLSGGDADAAVRRLREWDEERVRSDHPSIVVAPGDARVNEAGVGPLRRSDAARGHDSGASVLALTASGGPMVEAAGPNFSM